MVPLALITALACAPESRPAPGHRLDARFVADRIFVHVPVAGSADTLRFYTDTGGGLFLLGRAADRIGMGDSAIVRLSALASGLPFPDPLDVPDGRVPVFRPEVESGAEYDGMLGQAWFADRVWRIDYASETLELLEKGIAEPDPGARVPLAFRTDSTGARALSFPRLRIAVDGDSLDMLLDTGATWVLTDSARAFFGEEGPERRATSFITTEVFERWRERHPDWRVIPSADRTVSGMSMIEVPEVAVGGHAVGPVWFTQRPDAAFHEYMARFMDRPLDGALGGNALRFFTLTIDYPEAAAFFHRNATR